MLIVLDANVWIKEKLLRSSLSAALLYALQNTDSKIVLTDTIRQEVEKKIIKMGAEAVQQIQDGLNKIQVLTGEKPKIPLPTRDNFAESVDNRFAELENLTHPINQPEEHLRSALDRVINGQPPSANKEQFRDALLWEASISLATQDSVAVISDDRDFYQDRGAPQKGLARELEEEVAAIDGHVSLFPDIGTFLKEIKQDVEYPDPAQLASRIHEAVADRLYEQAESSGYRIGDMCAHEIDAYLTEDQDRLAVEFRLEYEAFDVPHKDENTTLSEATLLAEGSCMFSLNDESISETQWDRISCVDNDNNVIPGTGAVFLKAEGAVIGIQKIPHRIRRKIN